jgi:hypothetical protein
MLLRLAKSEGFYSAILTRAKAAAQGRRFGEPLAVADPSVRGVETRGWSGSIDEPPRPGRAQPVGRSRAVGALSGPDVGSIPSVLGATPTHVVNG